jgi:uncharacterized protein (TIGR02996 family)
MSHRVRNEEAADEARFLNAIRSNPDDNVVRLAYAEWLDHRDGVRAELIRIQICHRSPRLRGPLRMHVESTMRHLGRQIDHEWLSVIAPEISGAPDPRLPTTCLCFDPGYAALVGGVRFHQDRQDTTCDAWKRLLRLIDEAAAEGRTEFDPRSLMLPEDWARIVTLPATISRLKAVTHLTLVSSHLVRIPPEIGEMASLEVFDPYMSYRLHWFPYEMTRCARLRDSRVSTRALYGNYKYRPPFPLLESTPSLSARGDEDGVNIRRHATHECLCSVCDQPFIDRGAHRVWISLRVATDVLPLLVNACSNNCVSRLPQPAGRYPPHPHRGGEDFPQPPREG